MVLDTIWCLNAMQSITTKIQLTPQGTKLEKAWIHRVQCYTPYGLNVDVDVNAFIDNA